MPLLKETIEQHLHQALKTRDRLRISVTRLLLAEIHNQEIARRGNLTDDQLLAVLGSAAKKHQDSIVQFKQGGRLDLVEQEEAELKVIQSYLPEPLTPAELRALIKQAVVEAGVSGPQDFGKVMQALMPKVKGRAPGQEVSQMVKEELVQNGQ